MIERYAAQTGSLPDKLSLEAAPAAVNELIRRILLHSDADLADLTVWLAREGGKNFRASLLLAAAAGPDGEVPRDAVIAAAALEILHLATLVHDDVIDDAPTRRGQPSLQEHFGKRAAVIGGDYLFCVCFSMIAAITARFPEKFSEFSRAMTQVCIGEMRQHKQNGNTELGLTGYLRTIAGKTAALFSLAMYSGSILGGNPEKEARLAARIGYHIGMLFQLADDCLDYETTTEAFRKSVKHDLGEGVITLPLILAFARDPALKDLVKGKVLSAAEINAIAEAVVQTGGVNATWQVASRYGRKARKTLARLADPASRERLGALLDAIEARSH